MRTPSPVPPWIDAPLAQASFDRQHQRDELGTRVHTALGALFCASLGGPNSVIEITGSLLVVYALIRAHNTWRTTLHGLAQPAQIAMWAFLGWTALALLWSPDRVQGLDELARARFAFIPLALWPILDRRHWLIAGLAAGFAIGYGSQIAHALGTYLDIPSITFPRFPGRNSGWWDPAVAGSMLMVPLGLHAAAAALGRGRWRLLGAIGFAATWVALLATGTRGAWISGFGLSAFAALAAATRALRAGAGVRTLVPIGIAAVIAVALGSTLLYPTIRDRVAEAHAEITRALEAGDFESSTGKRLAMYVWSARAFADDPVVGVGTGGFERASEQIIIEDGQDPARIQTHAHAHCAALHVAATQGAVGLALLGMFAIAFGVSAAWPRVGPDRARVAPSARGYAAGPAFAALGLLGVSVFDTLHINVQTMAAVGVLVALCPAWRPRRA